MRIGGLVKQSFIDWEGVIAAVIFTKGCNFRCGYCHNPSLVIPELMDVTTDITEEDVFSFLESRKQWLDGVVVTGGEPTIHADLYDFLVRIKLLGYKIKLDTNGTNPTILSKLIEHKIIDFVAMDIKTTLDFSSYTTITNVSNEKQVEHVLKSIHIIQHTNINHQFRTTILPEHHSSEIIERLKSNLNSTRNYKTQEFRSEHTLQNIMYI